jgi:MarR family transcriptional regulator, transcriptional regulator for hemolysin
LYDVTTASMECDAPLHAPREALSFRFDEIVRALSRRVDARLEAYDLSRAQWRLLAYIIRNHGMTQSEIARVLELERASVGQTIDIMERKQLLARTPSQTDRRVWRIEATQKARDLLPELRPMIDRLHDQMFAGFSESEIEQLGDLIDRIVNNIDDIP